MCYYAGFLINTYLNLYCLRDSCHFCSLFGLVNTLDLFINLMICIMVFLHFKIIYGPCGLVAHVGELWTEGAERIVGGLDTTGFLFVGFVTCDFVR